MAYTPYIPTAASGAYDPFSGFNIGNITYDNANYLEAGKKFGYADPRAVGALQTANMRYNGDVTRGLLGSGFTNLQSNLTNTLDQYAQYGGVFGDKNNPVYSPQSKNGYRSTWGNNNPFSFGSF